mmetsp:Transcript_15277/g.31691  ORF Transcript_15277/g.31691 Transcript_15277/m.31691 type:complete len:218 (-) Transcript_15277:206-859(-)
MCGGDKRYQFCHLRWLSTASLLSRLLDGRNRNTCTFRRSSTFSIEFDVQDQIWLIGDPWVAIKLIPSLVGTIRSILGRNRSQASIGSRQASLVLRRGREILLIRFVQNDIIRVVATNQRIVSEVVGDNDTADSTGTHRGNPLCCVSHNRHFDSANRGPVTEFPPVGFVPVFRRVNTGEATGRGRHGVIDACDGSHCRRLATPSSGIRPAKSRGWGSR